MLLMDECKGVYMSLWLHTDIDGNWVDPVANVDLTDSLYKTVR